MIDEHFNAHVHQCDGLAGKLECHPLIVSYGYEYFIMRPQFPSKYIKCSQLFQIAIIIPGTSKFKVPWLRLWASVVHVQIKQARVTQLILN